MAHGRREDARDDGYSGETYPRSDDASQHHRQNEQTQGPPPSMVSIRTVQ